MRRSFHCKERMHPVVFMIFLSEAFFWILITRIYWMFTVSPKRGAGEALGPLLKTEACGLLADWQSWGCSLKNLQRPVVWDHSHPQLKMPVRANRSLRYWSGCNWKEGKWGSNENALLRYSIMGKTPEKLIFNRVLCESCFPLLPETCPNEFRKTWRDICLSPWYRRTSFVFCR